MNISPLLSLLVVLWYYTVFAICIGGLALIAQTGG
jgi:bacteriorhodopsin